MPTIYVKVKPDSDNFEVIDKHILEVRLESKAEHNKANSELVRELEDISGEKVGIIEGHKSRRKKLKIKSNKQEFKNKVLDK